MVAKLSSFQKVVRTTGVALAWGLGGRGFKSAAPAMSCFNQMRAALQFPLSVAADAPECKLQASQTAANLSRRPWMLS